MVQTNVNANYIEKRKEQLDYFIREKNNGIYNDINKGLAQATGYILNYCKSFFLPIYSGVHEPEIERTYARCFAVKKGSNVINIPKYEE